MNCKPGDLAIIKNSVCGNDGVIVEVLYASPGNRFPSGAEYEAFGITWVRKTDAFCWVVRSKGRKLRTSNGHEILERPIYDADLIPIGNPEGEDETLTWAGKPLEAIAFVEETCK